MNTYTSSNFDSITTNRINLDINLDIFKKNFDIFKITTDKNYINYNSYLLDFNLLELDIDKMDNNIYSILFTSGFNSNDVNNDNNSNQRSFYVLLKKHPNNSLIIKNIISQDEDGMYMSYTQEQYSNLSRRTILQLLLNGLNSKNHKLLRFNNLTGSLYCISKTDKKNITDTIITLKINTVLDSQDDLFFDLSVTTFSNLNAPNYSKHSQKNLNKKAKYIYIAEKNIFKRASKKDLIDNNKNIYVIANLKNNKNNIKFLDINSLDKFSYCKMGILYDVMSIFNEKYSDFANISFKEVSNASKINKEYYKSPDKNYERNLFFNLIDNNTFSLIDEIQDDNSNKLCLTIINQLKNDFAFKSNSKSIDIKLVDKPIKDCINIRLIHNKEYYAENNLADPYAEKFKKFKDMSIQHITIEEFKKNGIKNASAFIVWELLLKNDLRNKKITLFEWEKMNYSGDWTFIKRIKINNNINDNINDKYEKYEYYTMTISPDGTFNIKIQEFNLFEYLDYNNLINIFETENKKINCIIKNHLGEINIIEDTQEFTIPNIQKIYELLSKKTEKLNYIDKLYNLKKFDEINVIYEEYESIENKKNNNNKSIDEKVKFIQNKIKKSYGLRSDERRLELLDSILDIKYIEYNNSKDCDSKDDINNTTSNIGGKEQYAKFCVGAIGDGMNTSISRASIIRKVIPYEDSPLFFDQLLLLMKVSFVRASGLTIIPFPFKYINAYIANNLNKNNI